jgi:hypothetical protein
MRIPFAAAAALAAALLVAARPVPAQTYVQGWKPVGGDIACENRGAQIYCLLRGNTYPTGTITVSNKHASSTVDFTWDEWHSLCGFPGGKVVTQTTGIAVGASKTLLPLSPGNGITCREIFIRDCKLGAATVGCPEVLNALGRVYVGNKQ